MSRVDALLADARSTLARLTPVLAARAHRDGALLVDIRPQAQRSAEGAIPGAIVVERTVLEWRLDPTSPDRIPEINGPHQVVIIVCSGGYSSSLAAASLQRLGLTHATDLDGGFQAWQRAGLPVQREPPVALA
jgi:rhodanese-related sulfurtransferase